VYVSLKILEQLLVGKEYGRIERQMKYAINYFAILRRQKKSMELCSPAIWIRG